MNVLSKLRNFGGSDGYTIPVLISLCLHGLLVLSLLIVAWWQTEERIKPVPSHVMAKVYGLTSEVRSKLAKKPVVKPQKIPVKKPEKAEKAEKAEKKKLLKPPEKKEPVTPVTPVNTDLDRQRALVEQQRREAERVADQAMIKRRREEAQRLQEKEMLANIEREQMERQRLAEQLEADASVVNSYVAIIEQLVRQNWSRPPSARQGMTVKLRVKLTPTGEMVSINILKSSGHLIFDDSAIRAVEKAAPFTELSEMENRLFERHFREFNFYFDPQDLLE
ncbi:MAG: TonB family protein [Endozoicomonadaceae bacterium]|nr:TonB family protein [Endozoicomonadaceae bacterium]